MGESCRLSHICLCLAYVGRSRPCVEGGDDGGGKCSSLHPITEIRQGGRILEKIEFSAWCHDDQSDQTGGNGEMAFAMGLAGIPPVGIGDWAEGQRGVK